MSNILDELYGTSIARLSMAADFSSLSLGLLVYESEYYQYKKEHIIDFHGISCIQFNRITPLPWDYTEITSINIHEKDNMYKVMLELWCSDNTLQIICSEIKIDGIDYRKY